MTIGFTGAASAEVLEFGWSGTVSSLDPSFVAALPAGSGVTLGSQAWARFEFESTTPDSDPSLSTGDYVGALISFRLRVGSIEFTQQTENPSNSIIVFSDPLFGFYEPQTTADASSPIQGFPDLKADVLFIPVSPTQIPDDSLVLTIPDPVDWSTASSAVLDPNGAVLLDVQLEAICVGPCQSSGGPWPVPTIDPQIVIILLTVLIACGSWQLKRRTDRDHTAQ
jgi:hypothetical protein